MASLNTFLQAVKADLLAESTLDFFSTRIQCTQAGYFNPERVRRPNLVISPAREAPRAAGRRLVNARDDVITVIYYAYQDEFGEEDGLFGDGDRLKGILDIATELKSYLDGNQFSGATVSEWVSTEYPTYFDRNFEMLSEVRLTFTYGLRGAYS